jgi:hypothetical protein
MYSRPSFASAAAYPQPAPSSWTQGTAYAPSALAHDSHRTLFIVRCLFSVSPLQRDCNALETSGVCKAAQPRKQQCAIVGKAPTLQASPRSIRLQIHPPSSTYGPASRGNVRHRRRRCCGELWSHRPGRARRLRDSPSGCAHRRGVRGRGRERARWSVTGRSAAAAPSDSEGLAAGRQEHPAGPVRQPPDRPGESGRGGYSGAEGSRHPRARAR